MSYCYYFCTDLFLHFKNIVDIVNIKLINVIIISPYLFFFISLFIILICVSLPFCKPSADLSQFIFHLLYIYSLPYVNVYIQKKKWLFIKLRHFSTRKSTRHLIYNIYCALDNEPERADC